MATAVELLTITIFCKMQEVIVQKEISLYKFQVNQQGELKFVIANYIEWDVFKILYLFHIYTAVLASIATL